MKSPYAMAREAEANALKALQFKAETATQLFELAVALRMNGVTLLADRVQGHAERFVRSVMAELDGQVTSPRTCSPQASQADTSSRS